MPYLTIRDILNRTRSFHGELADIYSRCHRKVKEQEAKLLLRFMVEQEEHIQESLKEHQSRFPPDVLDTWVQFFPQKPLDQILAGVRMTPEMKMDEVLERALLADQSVVRIFRQMIGATTAPRVQELFQGLCKMEEAKSSEYSRGTLGSRRIVGAD